MKHNFLVLCLSLGLATSAFAKTPKEVMEPYKAYRAALAANDKNDAAKYAYQAWQQAEELLGDSKTTGDLASNFAELSPQFIDEKMAWKFVMKAHKRAIDLAGLHETDPGAVEIDRRSKYLSWVIPNISMKIPSAKDKDYGTERLQSRISELGLQGSTFDAESVALSVHAAMISEDWESVRRDSLTAIKLFDGRTDGIFSVYEYAVPIYLARAYVEQNNPIDAALTYQALITKLESTGGHDNPISANAYGEWLRLRDEVAALNSNDPKARQVTSYTVPHGRTAELAPLIRIPPNPPISFLRGNKSGFVKVKFNVDINGYVINPVVTSSTNRKLHKATLESLKGWRYTPNLPEASSRDLETTIRYNIVDSSGKRLTYGEERSRL